MYGLHPVPMAEGGTARKDEVVFMLKLQNLFAGYGKQDVVHDVSFEVENNENLCIIGPNGCGKTTLLKAIAGILPSRGEIAIDGKSTRTMKHKEVSRRIAMMSQTSEVYFSYSVFDTVMMGRYLHIKDGFFGLPTEEDREFVLECIRAVDLEAARDQEITTLSGGQLQRVFLARTLAQEPEIILLDEPTNHLDLKYQIELIEYLREWSRQDGHSVIGVLHDINLAMRLSDKLMLMKDGGVRAYGSTEETVTRDILQEVYEVDVAGYMKSSLRRWEGLVSS